MSHKMAGGEVLSQTFVVFLSKIVELRAFTVNFSRAESKTICNRYLVSTISVIGL